MKALAALALMAALLPAQAGPLPPQRGPPAPVGLHIATDNATGALTLTWTMPAGRDPGAYTYSVHRDQLLLANGTDPSYTDTASGNPSRLYWVRAWDATGGSLPSSPVGFVPCHGTPGACQPEAATLLARWVAYSIGSGPQIAICQVATVDPDPFGYIIYWDCIWALVPDPGDPQNSCILHLTIPGAPLPRGLPPGCT